MSGEIIDAGGEVGRGNVVVEGRSGDHRVSVQLYQDIYNQITGKNEELLVFTKKPIRVDFEDIRQLDIKVRQILEQFQVISLNAVFTIFFDKNQKETHSSIERFSMLNSATSSCTESVVIKYDFSIVLPQTARPQAYSISIRVINRITAKKKIIEEFPIAMPRGFANMFITKTCEIRIEYVDYMVARTISTAFNEWVDALDESPNSKYLKMARRFSHFIPGIFKNISLCVVSAIIYFLLPDLIGVGKSAADISGFALLTFLFIFFSYKASSALGGFVEESIDSSDEVSFIDITKGDKKQISEACENNRNAFIKAAIGTIATFSINFFAKYLAIHLKI